MKNSHFSYYKIIFSFVFMILLITLVNFSSAETTCERDDCDITITIHMVAVGGTQQNIDDWIKDIEDVWNGYTYGDCECPVSVEVDFSGWVNNCSDPAASDNHCIEITPGPARDTAGNVYRGYMRGVSQQGSSITGWWSSNHMNQPATVGGVNYNTTHDAAHEAGHMLGLEDDYDSATGSYSQNIMGRTWGADATPTQDQINQVVENNCEGEDVQCPDHCCCGNGKVERDKGEECEENDDCKDGINPLCFACKCYYQDICGDGKITGDEECDPYADPIGCEENETCTSFCKCEEKGEIEVEITDPTEGQEITGKTDIEVDVESILEIKEVRFYIYNYEHNEYDLEDTDEEEPYEWELDPSDFDEGPLRIKVTGEDVQGNKDSDIIEVTIVHI